MKTLYIFQILAILSIPVLNANGQNPDDIYADGIKYYSEGSYDQALTIWTGLVDSGYISPDLYYNIGNAAFKTGKIPVSVLYYEKALLQRPFDEDIRYNLEIARSFVVDKFETIPELFISRWFRMVSLLFSSNGWAVISLVAFSVTLAIILIYLFSLSVTVKKLSFLLAAITLLISLSSMAFSFQNRSVTVKNRDAIIFSPAVTGKSSPDLSGKDLFVLHEGTKVKVEDEVAGWYEIRLSDGNVGWIPASDAEKI